MKKRIRKKLEQRKATRPTPKPGGESGLAVPLDPIAEETRRRARERQRRLAQAERQELYVETVLLRPTEPVPRRVRSAAMQQVLAEMYTSSIPLANWDRVFAALDGWLDEESGPQYLLCVNPRLGQQRPLDALRAGRLDDVLAGIEADRRVAGH